MTWLRRLVAACAGAAALAFSTPALAQGSPSVPPERQVLVMVRHAADHFRPNGVYGGGAYGDDLSRSSRERLARAIAKKHGLTFLDGWPMPMIGVDCFIMAVPDGRTTTAAANELSSDSKVAWAEPVQLYHAQGSTALPSQLDVKTRYSDGSVQHGVISGRVPSLPRGGPAAGPAFSEP